MKCEYCGSRIKIDDDNCRKCGAPTPEIKSPVYPPSGHVLNFIEYPDASGVSMNYGAYWPVEDNNNNKHISNYNEQNYEDSVRRFEENMKPTIWEKLFWPVVFLFAAGVLYGWFQFLMQYPGG